MIRPCGHSFKTPGARTFGIDVAKWGGEIDWHEVVSKLNPRFVFVQAFHVGKDEVSSYANPRFANYRRALQRLGDVLSDSGKKRNSSKWRHRAYPGWLKLERGLSDVVLAEIHAPAPDQEWQLLSAFLGFIDRHFGKRILAITIHYR